MKTQHERETRRKNAYDNGNVIVIHLFNHLKYSLAQSTHKSFILNTVKTQWNVSNSIMHSHNSQTVLRSLSGYCYIRAILLTEARILERHVHYISVVVFFLMNTLLMLFSSMIKPPPFLYPVMFQRHPMHHILRENEITLGHFECYVIPSDVIVWSCRALWMLRIIFLTSSSSPDGHCVSDIFEHAALWPNLQQENKK